MGFRPVGGGTTIRQNTKIHTPLSCIGKRSCDKTDHPFKESYRLPIRAIVPN
jgi:hypothetical protein